MSRILKRSITTAAISSLVLAPAMVAFAERPSGLELRRGHYDSRESERIYLSWEEEPIIDVCEIVGTGLEKCELPVNGEWKVNFGVSFDSDFSVQLSFYENRFYRYDIWFDKYHAEFVIGKISDALGIPKDLRGNFVDLDSIDWTQGIPSCEWEMGNVSTVIIIGATEGVMIVRYEPIAMEVDGQREPEGKAPFH